jgi:hypothetical protein
MADLNLLDFYNDSARILMALHRSFPRQIELYVEDLIGPDQTDEFGLHSQRHEACLGAILWLAQENLIRFGSLIRQEAVDQAILTARSMIALSGIHPQIDDAAPDHLPPAEQQEYQTFIEQIRRALKSESSSQICKTMRQFFEYLQHSSKPV